MNRRNFLVTSVLASAGAILASARPASARATRRILIAGGNFGTVFIRYMAELTGKPRPKLCFLPTASADSQTNIINWYKNCAPLNVEPLVQESFIESTKQTKSWDSCSLIMTFILRREK